MAMSGHQVVSMLYSIKGMAESHLLLAEEGRFTDPERRLEHAESILKTAHSKAEEALRVTRRIRILSASVSENKPVFLSRLCASVKISWDAAFETLNQRFSTEALEVRVQIPERFPEILCRQRDLTEIFYHLADNAIQALAGDLHGPQKMIFRAEYGFSKEQTPCAILTLADTGPGISEEWIQKIFDPFTTTKRPRKGSGLGLSLVRELVTQNSGAISVASSLGSGTAFTLEFPFRK